MLYAQDTNTIFLAFYMLIPTNMKFVPPLKTTRLILWLYRAFQGVLVVKSSPVIAGDWRDTSSIPGQEEPLEEEMAAHSVFLPGASHEQRSLAGYSPWGHRASDTTEVAEHTGRI